VTSLPVVGAVVVLAQWSMDWLGTAVGVGAGAWYLVMRRRVTAAGGQWSEKRTALFLTGIVGYLWCVDGFLNAYRTTLLAVWAVQVLTLMLVIPIALMAGRPVELAVLTSRRRSVVSAICVSRVARFVGHPFVGPAVVPLICGVLFFGRCADLWSSQSWIATVLGLVLVGVGCLIARPLASDDPGEASLAIGLALIVGIGELLLDAIPGIVLRLETHLVTVHFAVSHAVWAMSPLQDQRMAGSILWGVAEALDVPVLVLVFLRWSRADERESRQIDGLLDEAEISSLMAGGGAQPAANEPWWVTDPQMSVRLGGAAVSPESDAASFAAFRASRRRSPMRAAAPESADDGL
jgi:putative membrane protein